jgi:hypothetical protein
MKATATVIQSGWGRGRFSVIRGQVALFAGDEGSGRAAQTNSAARLRRDKSRVLTWSNRVKPSGSSRKNIPCGIFLQTLPRSDEIAARITAIVSKTLVPARRAFLRILHNLCPPFRLFTGLTRLTSGAVLDLGNWLPNGPGSCYNVDCSATQKRVAEECKVVAPFECSKSHDPYSVTPLSTVNPPCRFMNTTRYEPTLRNC